MTLAPVEVVVVAFPGNQFSGKILPELQRLLDAGTISIVDGLFLRKDENGDVTFHRGRRGRHGRRRRRARRPVRPLRPDDLRRGHRGGKLADLKAQGLLDDAEFAAAKARLLG